MFGDVLGVETGRVGPDPLVVEQSRVEKRFDTGQTQLHPLDVIGQRVGETATSPVQTSTRAVSRSVSSPPAVRMASEM